MFPPPGLLVNSFRKNIGIPSFSSGKNFAGLVILMLTIEKLLQHPQMRGIELLAGKHGILRPVEWACFVDILDDVRKIQAQELVITTGYGLGKLGWHADRVIPNLLKGRAAGLALQLGVYLQELPESILEEADTHSLPVLVLPENISSREILSVFGGDFWDESLRPKHLAMFQLAASLESGERDGFIAKVLGPLLQYDGAKGAELVETLKEFLYQDCNLNETAAKLKVHRHTVRYRLRQIEVLTGQEMHDYYTKLNFQLALFLCEL